MGKYVRIHSNLTIMVAPGLQNEDNTKKDSDVPNRMKVNPSWPRMLVTIFQGSHLYPAELADWATVKALVNDKVMSIGGFEDGQGESAEELERAKAVSEGAINELKEFNAKRKKAKKQVSLEEITSEEEEKGE